MKNKGPIFLCCAAILWSSCGVLSKFIPWSATTIACLRGLIAACVGFAALGTFKIKINKTKLLCAVCYFFECLLFIFANKLTTAGNAIVLQNTAPLYIILLSIWVYKQRPTKLDCVVGVAIFGGIVLALMGSLGGGGITGDLIALASGLFYAGIFFTSRLPGANPLESVIMGNCMFVVLIPFLFFDKAFIAPKLESWLAMLFMGVFQLGLSWVIFSKGIKTTPALQASFITMIEPVLSPIWAFLFLGEKLGPYSLVGSALVIITLIIHNVLSLKKQNKTSITPEEERQQLSI